MTAVSSEMGNNLESEVVLASSERSARAEVAYAWEYGCVRPELRALYEKAKDLSWNARTTLAWDTPVDPEGEIVSDACNPIFGTPMWQKLDPKREVPALRRHLAS